MQSSLFQIRATPSIPVRSLLAECLRRERTLTVFGMALLLAMVPTLVAHGLDERTLRGVGVWVKPLKFMASIGLFALTTAWLLDLLPAARRRGRLVRACVWTIVVTGGGELAYITWQAALGEASHYHVATPFHAAMYTLMGIGALLLTGTQAALAWRIARAGRTDVDPVWRSAVVRGLWLTFLLGAGAGGLLGGLQPPAGTGMAVTGWHLAGGDLRPAHFIGIHAQQFVPLAGLLLARWMPRHAHSALAVFIGAYCALWLAAMVLGLARPS